MIDTYIRRLFPYDGMETAFLLNNSRQVVIF